jgi:hypothetical protein
MFSSRTVRDNFNSKGYLAHKNSTGDNAAD